MITGEPTWRRMIGAKAESVARERNRPTEPDPDNAGEGTVPLPAFPRADVQRKANHERDKDRLGTAEQGIAAEFCQGLRRRQNISRTARAHA